jgi:hypothetical protein
MERNRSLPLFIVTFSAVIFSIYTWTDKREIHDNLTLAINEISELNHKEGSEIEHIKVISFFQSK